MQRLFVPTFQALFGTGKVKLMRRPFGRPKTTTTQRAGFQRFSEELAP